MDKLILINKPKSSEFSKIVDILVKSESQVSKDQHV